MAQALRLRRLVFAGEMKAVDPDENVMPPGEVGEIYMHRPEGSPACHRSTAARRLAASQGTIVAGGSILRASRYPVCYAKELTPAN